MGPPGWAEGGWVAQAQLSHGKWGKARRGNVTESFLLRRNTK